MSGITGAPGSGITKNIKSMALDQSMPNMIMLPEEESDR